MDHAAGFAATALTAGRWVPVVAALLLGTVTGCDDKPAAAGALQPWTPTANEQEYLTLLKSKNVQPKFVPWQDDRTLVDQAHQICADLPYEDWKGNTFTEAHKLSVSSESKYPIQQITWQISAAEETLCQHGR